MRARLASAFHAYCGRASDLVDVQHNKLFQRIAGLVEERLCSGITSSDLSALLHYHPGYLSRVVKEETGVSLGQYIIGRRMAAARARIVAGASVTDAALQVGYDNLSHFSRMYRKCFGVSPSQERKAPATETNRLL
ncbi:MAG TPA: AraC family transcriptional regulator [Clostridia bacterium]|nr:AraC family transcriptional regulator [Clostridia bacterium]